MAGLRGRQPRQKRIGRFCRGLIYGLPWLCYGFADGGYIRP